MSHALAVPERVARKREPSLFEGLRLLFKSGPSQTGHRNGQLIARIETTPLCFRHSIYSFRFAPTVTWQANVVLGVLWSSLARYFFFLTSSSWGMWHHTISLQEVRQFPLCLPDVETRQAGRITQIVQALRQVQDHDDDLGGLFTPADHQIYQEEKIALERDLDDAVFDLYGLTEPERDLVRDMCRDGLDLFYRHVNSSAVMPVDGIHETRDKGHIEDVPVIYHRRLGLEPYLFAFMKSWNTYVEPDGEFSWRIILPKNIPLLAVIFTAQTKDAHTKDTWLESISKTEPMAWNMMLEQVQAALPQAYHASSLYMDGLLRVITGANIIIIKRNERRLWTSSMARDDSEATMLQAIQLRGLLNKVDA